MTDQAAPLPEHMLAAPPNKSPNMLCFIEQFPLAMVAIAEIHDYERGPLIKDDYRPSLLRHLWKIGEHRNHAAAMAWNALAHLELTLRDPPRAKPVQEGLPSL